MSVIINTDPLDNNAALKQIGNAIMSYEPYRNNFYETIINKFALSILFSKSFSDQYAFMDRGMLQIGETVEGIYIDIAEVMGYDPQKAAGRELKLYDGNVFTAYAAMNWQKLYPISISEVNARQAFSSWGAMDAFIRGLIESLYNAMRYDHSVVKHYALARGILNGAFAVVTVPDLSDETNARQNGIKVQSTVNDMTLVNTKYNPARVHNSDKITDLYIITDNAHRSAVNYMVDAQAFNLDKVQWTGHILSTWPFAQHDETRLAELIDDYEPFTDDELSALGNVAFVCVAKDAMEVYINHRDMAATPVRSGAYTNYFLSDWLTITMWPWAQRAVFAEGDNAITGVTLTPTTATVAPGGSLLVSASVAGSGLYDSSVTYSVTGAESDDTQIVDNQLNVAKDETASTITVTATANGDDTKSAKCTVTVKSA